MNSITLPNVALLGFDKVTITVSFGSSSESLTMPAMVIVPDVAPALIVSVPLAKGNQYQIQLVPVTA